METIKTCPGCKQVLEPNAVNGLCPKCLMQAALDTGVDVGPDTQADSPHRSFVAPTPEELVQFFPQLEILELLGRGGMGAVYKARQKQLDRCVALKILPPGIGDDPAFAERFTREARALAKLNHPNIVTLHEFGQTDGLFFFIMEFVDGLNLRQLLEAGRIAPREALAIVPQICDALQYAHDAGIVHRDIKPENILLDRQGRVKVADFGLAKLVGQTETVATGTATATTTLTEDGKVVGTPQYMAPEQTEHPSEVDHRADIYSLGVVFYQMLTGELPAGKTFQPPSSRMRGIVVDVRLDEVVLRALEKEPERRYQQASILKTRVETILATPAQPQSEQEFLPAKPRGWRLQIIVVGRRGGKAVIHWPGVLIGFAIALGLAEAGAVLASRLLMERLDWRALLIALCGALLVTGIRIRRGRTMPVDQLMSLEGPHDGADVPLRSLPLLVEQAGRRRPYWPGVLQLCGTVGLVVGGSVLVIALALWLLRAPVRVAFQPGELLLMFLWVAASVVMFMAALRLGRDDARRPQPAEPAASSSPETPPRFSRTAIVGACWAPLFFIGFLMYFLEHAVPAGGNHVPEWWQYLLMFTLLPLGITAPFGTTILGCMALTQIRRSAGRLSGLGLALFDALLFPLLALDVLIGVIWHGVLHGLFSGPVYSPGGGMVERRFSEQVVIAVTLLTALLVDYFIIRQAWREANQMVGGALPANVPPPASSATNGPEAQSSRTGGWWRVAVSVAVQFAAILPLMAFGIFIVPKFLLIAEDSWGWLPYLTTLAMEIVQFVLRLGWLVLLVPALMSWAIHRWGGRRRLWRWTTGVAASLFVLTVFVAAAVIIPMVAFAPVGVHRKSIRTGNPPAANQTQTFGPVIERVVTNKIDLDTGSLQPEELKGSGHYSDALYEDPVFVFAASTKRIQLTGNDWDGLSPEQLQAALDKRINSSDITFNKKTAKLPVALGFRTSSGRIGILQITGFTDDPRGVKIRYKLVRSVGANAPTVVEAGERPAGSSSSPQPSIGQSIGEFDWARLAAEGRLLGGVPVTVDGRAALRIENTNDAPLQLAIFQIEQPAITARQYALTGEIKYEQVQGDGYLEMWNCFPPPRPGLPEAKYFTRTLGAAGTGPQARITGTSGWRAFALPFDSSGVSDPPAWLELKYPPARLELNLLLPGRGVVFLGPFTLSQSAPTAAPAEAAFGPVIERTFSASDADKHGLVFFDVETGQIVKTTVAPKFRSRTEMQFLELTPELRDWIHRTDVDLVLRFVKQTPEVWAYLLLGMEKQPLQKNTNPDRIQPQDVAAAFAAKDADRSASKEVRGPWRSGYSVPEVKEACGSGRSGFCDPEAEKGQQRWEIFRTRKGVMGLISMVGVDPDKDGRTLGVVKLRYALIAEGKALAGLPQKRWIGNVPGGLEITGPAEGFTQTQLRGWVEKRWRTEYPLETYQPLEWGEPEAIAPHGWVAIRVKYIYTPDAKSGKAKHFFGHRHYSFTKTGDFVRSDVVDGPEIPVDESQSAFGPVIEREIPFRKACLKLETGELLPRSDLASAQDVRRAAGGLFGARRFSDFT